MASGRLPPRIVEPLIAFSIVLIAIDNLRATKATWRRYILVFGFGLVHGLGFAGALLDLGLTRSELAPALAGFNVGIELGQLIVIAIAFGGRRLVAQPSPIPDDDRHSPFGCDLSRRSHLDRAAGNRGRLLLIAPNCTSFCSL